RLTGFDRAFNAWLAGHHTPPSCVIASGRRTLPYLARLKAKWGAATVTVFLKDPRTGNKAADRIWVPSHDRLRGPNVLATPTSPHRFTPETRDKAGRELEARLLATHPKPWLGVLLGGATGPVTYEAETQARLLSALKTAAPREGSVLLTPSRRTPAALLSAIEAALPNAWIWRDDETPNPYAGMLGACDGFLVTGDSHNMVSEVLATDKHVMVFRPKGLQRKFERFLDGMEAEGAIAEPGPLEAAVRRTPIDATPQIAAFVLAAIKGTSEPVPR
ncbi:MAG: mitochondrial fission ELM1 family protein, partial [Devosiaceae bacterium]|nr:mitochondrial fission ELM1 family protein [Devosiaceae bacterium MH13]